MQEYYNTSHYNHLRNFKNIAQSLISKTSIYSTDIGSVLYQMEQFEKSTLYNDTLIILFNYKTCKPLYVSDNLSQIWKGVSKEQLIKESFDLYIPHIIPEQRHLPGLSLGWSFESKGKVPAEVFKAKFLIYECGITLQFGGEVSKYLIRCEVNSYDEQNQPVLVTWFINNINHLFKGDFFWARHVIGKEHEHTFFYSTLDNNSNGTDILTTREKEVLQLIAKNKNSREIAQTLNISVNTVEKHRKNMLARSGAINTTALIQLCKLCKII